MYNYVIAKKRELSKLPKGYLVMRNDCYYHRLNGKDVGITKNVELIKKLARKQYLKLELKILEENERLMKAYSEGYKPINPHELISKMSNAYKKLPFDYFMGKKESEVHQSENPYKRELLIYKTNGGVFVRTKSELIIGNFLEAHGIKYWYEAKFLLGGRWIYPDFLIENPITHEIIPMEHLGMLGEPDYDQRNKKKLKDYIDNDYFPGHNLICTYEQDIMEPGRLEMIMQLFGVL